MATKTASTVAKGLNLKPKTRITLPPKPQLLVASDVMPREMRWLWYPYIPSSAASLFFGPGGGGKSHITVAIASALSNGKPLPGQEVGGKPQKVLMLSAEDDFDVVLVPRLIAQGADLDRIAFPSAPFTLDARGLQMIEEYMHEFSATVVFIDPIVEYMGGKIDMNKANEVRGFMGPLHQMAMKKQTAVVLVGHSRKARENESGDDYERIMGSADFSNAVRSVMFVTRAMDGTRVMRHVKHNYSPAGETLAFDFGDNGFEWKGAIDEDGMVSAAPLKRMTRTQTAIEKWLRGVLADGPVRALDIPEMAKAAGYGMRTVNKLKPFIAESYMTRMNGSPVWFWKLKDEGDLGDVPVQSVEEFDGARGLPGPPPGRRSARGSVDSGARGGAGGEVQDVGETRPVRGNRALPAGPTEAKPQDPKALAKAFLRGIGAE